MTTPNGASALARLFPEIGATDFVRDFYATKPLIVKGDASRFELSADPELFAVGSLLEKGAKDILNAYLRPPDGKSFHLRIQADSAKALFDAGGTIEVARATETFPSLRALAQQLADELGAQAPSAVVIVSPGGDALPMHFDQQDVFILQLSGRKKWLIAKNDSVEDPVDSYFPRTVGAGRDDALWPAYFPWSMPSNMPDDHLEVVLEPGSVAYVPRGWWHQTISQETSISITILCTPRTFSSLFLERLGKALAQDALMRRAVVLPFDQERRARTENEIEPMIRRAAEIAATLRVEDLSTRPFVERQFFRSPGTTLSLSMAGEAQHVAVVTRDGETLSEVQIDEEVVELCQWLSKQESFTGKMALTATNEKDVDIVQAVVGIFVEAGYLSPPA